MKNIDKRALMQDAPEFFFKQKYGVDTFKFLMQQINQGMSREEAAKLMNEKMKEACKWGYAFFAEELAEIQKMKASLS